MIIDHWSLFSILKHNWSTIPAAQLQEKWLTRRGPWEALGGLGSVERASGEWQLHHVLIILLFFFCIVLLLFLNIDSMVGIVCINEWTRCNDGKFVVSARYPQIIDGFSWEMVIAWWGGTVLHGQYLSIGGRFCLLFFSIRGLTMVVNIWLDASFARSALRWHEARVAMTDVYCVFWGWIVMNEFIFRALNMCFNNWSCAWAHEAAVPESAFSHLFMAMTGMTAMTENVWIAKLHISRVTMMNLKSQRWVECLTGAGGIFGSSFNFDKAPDGSF